MSRIFKYPLLAEQRQVVMMPYGAKILSVHWQNEQFVLFAQVEPDRSHVPRVIRLVVTGEEFNAVGLTYIGTLTSLKGWFTAHFYEQPASGALADPLNGRFVEDLTSLAEPAKVLA